jgi:GDP-4-dehydro-6-deoxy-D-mannose reductase
MYHRVLPNYFAARVEVRYNVLPGDSVNQSPPLVKGEKRVRALITGITGFAGGHLAEILLERGHQVFGVARDEGAGLQYLNPGISPVIADLQHPAIIEQLLNEVQPDALYHLAGQAFVPTSWSDPWDTLANNIRPQLNILQAMVNQKSSARLLIVASNQVYGHVETSQMPVDEETPLRPDNPYGVSKVAQDILGLQYHLSHGLDIIRVRPFNHIGPRQSPVFVASSFARQIAWIEAGLSEPVIKVGNLEARRDFTDVIDVMQAYALLVEQGQAGEAYNIGTGQAYSIQYLLDTLLGYTNLSIKIEQEPDRMRPSDISIIYADNSKLRATTGWEPTISFENSLRRVLDYWRAEAKSGRK